MFRSWSSLLSVTIFIVQLIANNTDAYRILMLPLNGKSHVFAMLAIAEELAHRGHESVIVVSNKMHIVLPVQLDEWSKSRIRLERYDATEDLDEYYEHLTATAFLSEVDVWDLMFLIKNVSNNQCRDLLVNNEPLMASLADARFDLAIVDLIILAPCLYLVPHRLKIRHATSMLGFDPLLTRVPPAVAFAPVLLPDNFDERSLIDRLRNLVRLLLVSPDDSLTFLDVDVFQEKHGRFGSLAKLASSTVLWLVSVNYLLDYAMPAMPHVIHVGGLTAKPATGQLQNDVVSFIEGAPNGTVFVSFGTVASRLPQEVLIKLFSTFRRFDADGIRFLFRLNNTVAVLGVPSNVLVRNWVLQNDVLAHQNVKLFITHCGNNGQFESLYHGVPMIGFPVFGDQMHNAHRMERKGLGLQMNIRSFQADQLADSIRHLLTNSSYSSRAAKASAIFRDQPQNPAERAAYWIEHVCRFGGDHLRSGGHDLPWYAFLMLDVLAVVLLIAGIAIWLVYALMHLVLRGCKGNRSVFNKDATVKVKLH